MRIRQLITDDVIADPHTGAPVRVAGFGRRHRATRTMPLALRPQSGPVYAVHVSLDADLTVIARAVMACGCDVRTYEWVGCPCQVVRRERPAQ